MTRDELTAKTEFQQSIRALTRPNDAPDAYGLRAESGYLGKRNPETGDRSFTTTAGVEMPTRNLKTGSYPIDRGAVAVEVLNGQSYVR